MEASTYENELRRGLTEAIGMLTQINGFVLHSFNIWTDPEAGVSAFSADTRSNSERFVREAAEWQDQEARKLRAAGRHKLAKLIEQPRSRTDNPADFEYRNIVRIEHSNWEHVMANVENRWDVVEPVLMRLRDAAAQLINRTLRVEPDAQVSIGTREDWYDRSIPILARPC